MTPLHLLSDDPKEPWELLFRSDKEYRVEIMKGLLEEEEITSVIMNKQDSSYLIFGEVQLFVRRCDILRAEQILKKFLERE
jgi:hypothetical protein